MNLEWSHASVHISMCKFNFHWPQTKVTSEIKKNVALFIYLTKCFKWVSVKVLRVKLQSFQIEFNRLLILTEICNSDQIVSMVDYLESYSGCNEYHCHSSLSQLSSIQFHGKLTDNKLNVHWLHFILHLAQIPKRLSFWPWLLLWPWLLHSLFCNHLGLNWTFEEFH